MPVGFIEVAADQERLEEFRRVAAFNRLCGLDVVEISPAEVKELWPLAKVDDILAGFYVKEDARVNPIDVTMSMAKGARMKGVNVLQNINAANKVCWFRGAVLWENGVVGEIVLGCCAELF